MKGKEPIAERDLVWRQLAPCEVCHKPLEVANISECEVRLRHVESKVSYEVCRQQRRLYGKRE